MDKPNLQLSPQAVPLRSQYCYFINERPPASHQLLYLAPSQLHAHLHRFHVPSSTVYRYLHCRHIVVRVSPYCTNSCSVQHCVTVATTNSREYSIKQLLPCHMSGITLEVEELLPDR